MLDTKNLNRMQIFTIIWMGQLVSLLGSRMTRFALMIWAYQQTGSATTLALIGFFAWVPYIVLSPVAGVWVDRLDRRWVLILSDVGSGVLTLLVIGLFQLGSLAIWHIYLLEAASSLFDAFQGPAYVAATSTLLPKASYGRANGMRSLAQDGTMILAPIMAGALLPFIGIGGIMLIDVATFLVAVFTLGVIHLPTAYGGSETAGKPAFGEELRFGFRYIFTRKGLLGLMALFMGIEFFATLTYFSVMPALILARTGGNERALGIVQATLGAAGVVGGLLMSIFGLPRRKIHAVCGLCALSFLGGDLLFAIGRTVPHWMLASAVAAVFIPFISGANRTIWQTKVAPQFQGRVLAVSNMFTNAPKPFAYLLAGPLADRWFGPAMQPNGALAPFFGWIVGTGPGAGIGLMFVGTAILGALMSLSGYLFRAVRQVEDELPDYDAEEHNQSEFPFIAAAPIDGELTG